MVPLTQETADASRGGSRPRGCCSPTRCSAYRRRSPCPHCGRAAYGHLPRPDAHQRRLRAAGRHLYRRPRRQCPPRRPGHRRRGPRLHAGGSVQRGRSAAEGEVPARADGVRRTRQRPSELGVHPHRRRVRPLHVPGPGIATQARVRRIADHSVAVSQSCLSGGPRVRRADRQCEAHQQFAGVGATPDTVVVLQTDGRIRRDGVSGYCRRD